MDATIKYIDQTDLAQAIEEKIESDLAAIAPRIKSSLSSLMFMGGGYSYSK